MPAPRGQPLLVTGSSERNHSGRLSGPARGKRPRGQAADKGMEGDNLEGREGPPEAGVKPRGGLHLETGSGARAEAAVGE